MKYEFRDMINEPYSPIVYLNQDEIDQIKNNNDYINMNNLIQNEKKEIKSNKTIIKLRWSLIKTNIKIIIVY